MAKPLPLPVWDRHAGKLIEEFMDDHPSTYESRPRRSLNQWLESEPLYDWLPAAYQNTRRSARQIGPFIRKHNIDMSEFKPVIYRSFAEFFDREFRLGARTFVAAPDQMAAFAEARYFGWERLEADQQLPVKGHSLSAEKILGNEKRAAHSLVVPCCSPVCRPWITTMCIIPTMARPWISLGSAVVYGRSTGTPCKINPIYCSATNVR
jgi:phosphatidylserine decarboxylase